MRLLIPVFSPATGTWGGLTRALAIAEAARSQGHEVAFCGSGYVEESLRRRGHRVYPVPATTMLGLPRPLSRRIVARAQTRALPIRPGRSVGDTWLVLAVTGMARSAYLRQAVDAQLRAVTAFGPDALYADIDPAAFLTAAISRIPMASAYSQIMDAGTGSLPWRLTRRAMATVLEEHGLAPRDPEQVFFGPDILKIIPSVPELDEADPDRPDILYVGSMVSEIRPQSLADSGLDPAGRFTFVYPGTGSMRLATLERVLPELFPQDGPRTCVVAGHGIASPYRIAGVEFRPYVSAEALLPRCDWTICHAGQNTIVQSLRHGVPLITFPGPIFERRFNAGHLQRAGAGVMGELDELTPAWLRAAMGRHEHYQRQAAALGERIVSLGGAPAAVEAIAAHASMALAGGSR